MHPVASNKSASSRSSVMVERIDVSVRCNFENTRSDSHVVTGIEVYADLLRAAAAARRGADFGGSGVRIFPATAARRGV
jgi:hypothetical protein